VKQILGTINNERFAAEILVNTIQNYLSGLTLKSDEKHF
jgi:hypothetical protein